MKVHQSVLQCPYFERQGPLSLTWKVAKCPYCGQQSPRESAMTLLNNQLCKGWTIKMAVNVEQEENKILDRNKSYTKAGTWRKQRKRR